MSTAVTAPKCSNGHSLLICLPIVFILFFSHTARAQLVARQTAGPRDTAGFVQVRALQQTRSGALLVGTDSGIYRAARFGMKWERVADVTRDPVNQFAMDAGGTLYAAVGTNSSGTGGAFRSRDDGVTWEPFGPAALAASAQGVATSNGGIVSIAWRIVYGSDSISSLISSSVDSGAHWNTWPVPPNGASVFDLVLACGDSNTIYALSQFYLFRSLDNGMTFDTVFTLFPNINVWQSKIAAYKGDIYIAGSSLWHSTNRGGYWTSCPNLPVDKWMYSVAVTDSGELIVLSDSAIEASTDRGYHWSDHPGMAANKWWNWSFPYIALSSQAILCGAGNSDLGVFRTTNLGADWDNAPAGWWNVPFVNVRAVAYDALRGIALASCDTGVFRSFDLGAHWERLDTSWNRVPPIKLLATNSGAMVAVSDSEVLRSTDDGSTWSRVLRFAPGYWSNVDLALHPSGSLAVVAGCELYTSSDDGVSWDSVPGAPRANAMTICPDGIVLLLGSPDNSLYRQESSGQWRPIGFPIPYAVVDVACSREDVLYYAAEPDWGEVYRSRDTGTTWTVVAGSFNDVFHVAFPFQSEWLFLGGNQTLTASSDQGETWGLLVTDRHYLWLGASDFCRIDDRRFFAATTQGVFIADVGTSGVRSQRMTVPHPGIDLRLSPNPAATELALTYRTTFSTNVAIDIVNVLGNSVRSQISQRGAGRHVERIDVSGLPAGSYLLTARAGNVVQSARVMVVH